MPRTLLPEARLHPAIQASVAAYGADLIAEVEAALAAQRVVVVGMAQNPFVRRARRALDAAGIAYRYLEYGSYFSLWRRRLALKMWTGWATFPMVFVDGQLIGGASDLQRLLGSGALK